VPSRTTACLDCEPTVDLAWLLRICVDHNLSNGTLVFVLNASSEARGIRILLSAGIPTLCAARRTITIDSSSNPVEVRSTSTFPAQTVLHVRVQTRLPHRGKCANVMSITTFVRYNDDYVGHIATVSPEPVNADTLVVLRAFLLACNPLEVNPWFISPVLDCLSVDCRIVRIVVVRDLHDRIDVECCHHEGQKLHQTP